MKLFQDKTLGPSSTAYGAASERGRGGAVREDVRCRTDGGWRGTGGEWASFGLPAIHQMFFLLGVKVADQFHVYGCGLTVGVEGGGGADEAAGKGCS